MRFRKSLRKWLPVVAFVLTLSLVVAMLAIRLGPQILSFATNVIDTWNSLRPGTQTFLGIAIPLVIAFIVWLVRWLVLWLLQTMRRSRRVQIAAESRSSGERQFPFFVFTSENLSKIEAHLAIEHTGLSYANRLPAERQDQYLRLLREHQKLIVTGRRGIGKTREVIELLRSLAAQKGEIVHVLLPREDFDRPEDRSIPANFAPRNVVLFIDDADQRCKPTRKRGSTDGAGERGFHDRLSATMEWMAERFEGRDWRVLLTAHDEPEQQKRLQLDSEVWSDFEPIQLQGIHSACRAEFIRAAAKHFGFDCESGVVDEIARRSDGTFSAIIVALRREKERRKNTNDNIRALSIADVSGYEFRYPTDWERVVFGPIIKSRPERLAVFNSLAIIRQAGLPAYKPLVIALTRRVSAREKNLLLRFVSIENVIERDLKAWVFESDGLLFCPNAYLDGRATLDAYLVELIESLLILTKSPKHRSYVQRVVPSLIVRLAYEADSEHLIDKLIDCCLKHMPASWEIWKAKADFLGMLAKKDEALVAAKRALRFGGDSAAVHITLAFSEARTGNYSAAEDAARRAIVLAPRSDVAHLILGIVLSRSGRAWEAIPTLTRAVQLNPRSAKAWYSLGVAYDLHGNRKSAIEACDKATKLDPADDEAWHTLGIALHRDKQLQRANMALSKAIALDACDAAKYLSLGRVRAALGEIEDAESLFQKALELIAKDSRMLTKVSIAFFKIQRFDRGAESALQAIRVDGADPEAWLWYANSVSKLGDRTRELGAREKVARLTGRSSDWARLSTSARRYGHIDLAVHAASNATRAEPGAACGWIALAKARIAQGACAEELREVSDEMVRLAKTAEDLCGAAEAFARMGEFHKAVELLEKSTRDEPAHGRAWELLAKVYLRIPGERQKAVLARRNWAERTKTVEAWIRHSQVCFRQGLYEEAVEAANNALGLDPNDVGARVLRARCLQQIPGRSKDAADAANRARRVARHPDHLAELSGYFNRSGLYDVAEELASAALALAPSHPVALRERESALRQKGVVERGGPLHESEIQALLNELRKERESADKWISTAKRLASANGADRMLAFVEEVVREDSHYSRGIDQALWEIVNIHPNGVVRLARRLTEIVPVPKVAAVWFLLGVAQRKCGDASGAVESIKEAVAINSDRAEFWYTLGKCNIEAGRLDDSIVAFERALKLRPAYPKAQRQLDELRQSRRKEGQRPVGHRRDSSLN